MSCFHCISGFEGTSYENFEDAATNLLSFISCCFYYLLHQQNRFLQIFRTSFNIQLYIANSIDPVNIAPVEEKYLFCSVQKHLLRVNSKDCNNVLNLFSVIHLNFRIQINVDDFRKMIQFPFSSMEFFLPTQKIKIYQNIF